MLHLYKLDQRAQSYFDDGSWVFYDLCYPKHLYVKSFYTFLPVELEGKVNLYQFKGGYIEEEITEFYKWGLRNYTPQFKNIHCSMDYPHPHAMVISRLVEAYLRGSEDHIYSISEVLVNKDDNCFRANRTYMTHGNRVLYYGISPTNNMEVELSDGGIASPPYFNTILTNSCGLTLSNQKDLTHTVMTSLINNAEIIILGAYDGQGYLIGELRDGAFMRLWDRLQLAWSWPELK